MSEDIEVYDRATNFKLVFARYFEQLTDPEHLTNELTNLGFFTAPASAKHHLNYEGGLYDHCRNVTNALIDLTYYNHLKWSRPESPYIVGMFHDLCKFDEYIRHKDGKITSTVDGWTMTYPETESDQLFSYNTQTLLKGHGDKSVMLASTLMSLTPEEVLCIRYHMGAFTDKEEWNDYTRAIHAYPNVLWTHQADMIATHITEANS